MEPKEKEQERVEQTVGENNGQIVGKGHILNLTINNQEGKPRGDGWQMFLLWALLTAMAWVSLKLIFDGG